MSQYVAIVGASADQASMSNKAVRAYKQKGYTVIPVSETETEIEGLECFESVMDIIPNIDIASFYVSPQKGMECMDDCSQKGVAQAYLNPGSESDELIAKAESLNIKPIVGCCIRAIDVDPDSL